MALTFHHQGADQIPLRPRHALLHSLELAWLSRSRRALLRQTIEAWLDLTHERLTVQGIAHVCQVNDRTGMLRQIWVWEPKAVLEGKEP